MYKHDVHNCVHSCCYIRVCAYAFCNCSLLFLVHFDLLDSLLYTLVCTLSPGEVCTYHCMWYTIVDSIGTQLLTTFMYTIVDAGTVKVCIYFHFTTNSIHKQCVYIPPPPPNDLALYKPCGQAQSSFGSHGPVVHNCVPK